ncbi:MULTISPECIES: chorismate synthase [unclassified Clostridioides]|uniref:chorismate synthase n=1 Tax=unclassified Clostridioides TaxID=2635829 RepID=UPI001D12F8A6|nr:chorismate synthase [Clostridioides sp. ES-S-0171-01]MCC0687398.1 chorismate synthase [Clostridioides sp. ES-S-0056-01]UDN56272.1 chorismate synthase [Clostridioides sp. ES-S-0054-01]
MSGIWGNNLKISIFGESHGNAIGINIDGLPSGIELDLEKIDKEMKRRAPGKNSISTSRNESDIPEILSGYFNGRTTGTPLCAIIRNSDTRSKDYGELKNLMRPGHADFTGHVRYSGFNDYRGGGHFSGRITAPLVFCGAICKQILLQKGIEIGAHIKKIKNIEDMSFDYVGITKQQLSNLQTLELPLLDLSKEEAMKNTIIDAKNQGDSVGGIVECAVVGVNVGIGNPFFDSVESTLSHLLFSVPSVKGVEFGLGFKLTDMYGSQSNDEMYYEGIQVKSKTNNNGGIIGGITTGMPIIFKVAIKPTPSISRQQNTVNIKYKKDDILSIKGRHDPCIVQRAIPVIEAVTAIGIFDLMKGR